MEKIADKGSRERMIEATIGLLRASGLSGAGINEIVRESGAPKGSIYHYFPNGKKQIAMEALAVYSQRVMDFIDRALAKKRLPNEKVKVLFSSFAQRVQSGDFRQSCAVGTVSLDLESDLEEIRNVLAGAFREWIALIERHFDFGAARRTKSFAGLLLTNIEGAYVRCRAERSSLPFTEAGAWLAELAERHA